MKKDLEKKIKADLKPLMSTDDDFDYVLYGKVSPSNKRIVSLLVMWITIVVGVIFQIVPLHWLLAIIVIVAIGITYNYFYEIAYVGKFGKRFYIHTFDHLHTHHKKVDVLLKDVVVCMDRTSEFHVTIDTPMEDNRIFIFFKRRDASKGVFQQATYMKQMMNDINKKHKK